MFEGFKNQLNQLLSKLRDKELSEKDVLDKLEDLKILLIRNDVALEAAEEMIEEVRKEVIGKKIKRFSSTEKYLRESLRKVLLKSLNVESIDVVEVISKNKRVNKVTKIVFMGVNGVGKTLTIAKLTYLLKKLGFKVVLSCSDTFRAGAIEQLEEHAKKLGVKMIKRPYGADPASVAYDAVMHAEARGLDVVMIDTAGRMHTNVNLMDELRKIIRVVEPDLTILVVDALTGHDALLQSRLFSEKVGFDGVIVTKVDANATCGSIISIIHESRKPILYLGTGSKYSDLARFNLEEFVSTIVGGG